MALRIVAMLVRPLTMPPCTFLYGLVRAGRGNGETWVNTSRVLALELGIPSWESLPQRLVTRERVFGVISEGGRARL